MYQRYSMMLCRSVSMAAEMVYEDHYYSKELTNTLRTVSSKPLIVKATSEFSQFSPCNYNIGLVLFNRYVSLP